MKCFPSRLLPSPSGPCQPPWDFHFYFRFCFLPCTIGADLRLPPTHRYSFTPPLHFILLCIPLSFSSAFLLFALSPLASKLSILSGYPISRGFVVLPCPLLRPFGASSNPPDFLCSSFWYYLRSPLSVLSAFRILFQTSWSIPVFHSRRSIFLS